MDPHRALQDQAQGLQGGLAGSEGGGAGRPDTVPRLRGIGSNEGGGAT